MTTYDATYLNPQATSRLGNPYLFTGRELDSETLLYYYRARTYDPVQGRFKQLDPIGYADGWNLYSYVTSSPTNWTEPSGLQANINGVIPFTPSGIRVVSAYVIDNPENVKAFFGIQFSIPWTTVGQDGWVIQEVRRKHVLSTAMVTTSPHSYFQTLERIGRLSRWRTFGLGEILQTMMTSFLWTRPTLVKQEAITSPLVSQKVQRIGSCRPPFSLVSQRLGRFQQLIVCPLTGASSLAYRTQ